MRVDDNGVKKFKGTEIVIKHNWSVAITITMNVLGSFCRISKIKRINTESNIIDAKNTWEI